MHKIVNIDRETYSIMQISHQIASVIKIRNLAKIQKWQTFQKKFAYWATFVWNTENVKWIET